MTKDEALAFDLALEALEVNNQAWKSLADSGDAGFWEAEEQPFYELSVKAITAIKQARALDKKAENARELGLDYEPVAPVQEDWGPGPHEVHSLPPAAPVQEPVAWRYRGILHDFDPSDWAEGPVTPLYATPSAQPAPVQEPVAFFDPQGKGFYWAKPTKITAPVTVDFEPLPLYTTPPAAPVQERNFCERCGKRLGDYIHTCTPPATKEKNT